MKEENGSSLTDIISSYENPIYGVAEKLREEGYEVAGRLGIVNPKQLDPNMIGILKDRGLVQKKFLGFIKYKTKQRAFHLGTIWMNDHERGAIEDKKWILNVNKSKYESKLTEIVEKLSASYGVELQIISSNNFPGRETYLHELY